MLTEAGLSIAVAVEVQHRTAELSGEVIVRRRLEAQARESEARFRTIFENSTDLLQSVDALGGFVQVNPAWKRLLGYTDDDLKHLNLFDVVAPEDAAIVEGLLPAADSRRAGRAPSTSRCSARTAAASCSRATSAPTSRKARRS